MQKYYCSTCAAKRGYLSAVTSSLLKNNYQLDKYIKHTVPNPSYPVQSVFDSASTQAYQNYIVSASLSGSVQIDDQGRKNIIWIAGKKIGFKYENGKIQHPENCVKVVLSTDSGSIHAYSQSSTEFFGAVCSDCGRIVVY